jgi:Type I phosphodiesterase / nucleotide pyrophosphatase
VKSIADVLPSACALLGVPGTTDVLDLGHRLPDVQRIAVLLIDGLGHRLLPVAAPNAPLLADVVAGRFGHLDELVSEFPSTTPTNVVSFGTGVRPGEHGILGFSLNVPGTDRVLAHVRWQDDPPVSQWQPVPTLFTRASAAGVRSSVVAHGSFAGTGLSTAAYGAVDYVAADDIDALATGVITQLNADVRLVYGYHPDLDRAAHRHGIGSPRFMRAAAGVDELVTRIVTALPGDAALLVTADHGGLDIPQSARFDVGTDPVLSAGVRIVAGEPRVRYLHTEPGADADVLAAWRELLAGHADVLSRDEAVASGLFGPVRPQHLDRIGDVVVICQGDTAVMATGWEPPEVAKLIGMHGGRTPVETAIPLMIFGGSASR